MTAPDDVELPGLPRRLLDPWLRRHLPEVLGPGTAWTAEVISGGLSNITYRLRTPDATVILRRPPLGGVLATAHDMGREQRVITALAGSGVPVPRVLASTDLPDVIGAPFYVMTEVTGLVVRTSADAAALRPVDRADIGRALADVLAQLHRVDPEDVGLGRFGRADGYVARQVRRWSTQWQATRTVPVPDMERLLGALSAAVDRLPPGRASVVHGDYCLDNVIVRVPGATAPGTARIAAVLDWELSTLGDPLADLGTALTYWHDVGDAERDGVPVARGVTAHPGFPTRRQFAEVYANATGLDLSDLAVYEALGTMKLGVILQGVHARHAAGHTVSAGYGGVESAVPVLASRGLQLLRQR